MKYRIRSCRTLDELAACVKIQKEIWGYSEHELYPQRLFINLGKIGGHVLGVFTSQGALAGFVASMPAWHGRERYYHSLSLGVVRGHENRGLGTALKLAQRQVALADGIHRIEWTFDPLRAKNAHLNIHRLGAIVRQYLPDYYGHVDSRFQRGLPSDRLVAEWHLNSARVRRALVGKSPRSWQQPPAAEVTIPPNIDALLESRPAEALSLQAAIRKGLLKHFRRGLAVTGFCYDGQSARYLLDPYED